MNKQVVPINESVHDQVNRLLPWFVANTLHGAERDLVSQHLNVCPDCQIDFALQCKLQSIEPLVDYAGGDAPDVDRALAAMRRRIDLRQPSNQVAVDTRVRQGSVRMPGFGMTTFSPWVSWALAAQFLLIVGLTVRLLALPDNPVSGYRTLGTPTQSNANLIVSFKPDTAERDMRGLLRHAGARIVGGPTVTDAYLLQVPDDQVHAVRDELAAQPSIAIAEVLRGGTAR